MPCWASLKKATKGMISDFELMNAALDMSLIANTEEGIIRLVSATSQLGTDMNQLTMTMLNDSTMRLDQLGLSANRVLQIRDELRASGFVGDAFDEAVIIALEEKVALFGDAAETTAGKMAMIETAIENAKNAGLVAMTEAAAEGLGNMADGAMNTEMALVSMAQQGGAAIGSITGLIEAGVHAMYRYEASAIEARIAVQQFMMDVGSALNLSGLESGAAQLQASQTELNQLQYRYGMYQPQITSSRRGGGTNWQEAKAAASETAAATDSLLESERQQRLAIRDMRAEGFEYIDTLNLMGMETAELANNTTAATGSFSGFSSASQQLEADMLALASATGDYYQQAENASDINPVEALKKAMQSHGASAYEQYLFDIASGLKSAEEAQKDLNARVHAPTCRRTWRAVGEGAVG